MSRLPIVSPTDGFTLFEVAIALAVVAVAITATLLLFPVGLKSQQQARFQIYACAKMLEIQDALFQQEHHFSRRQTEAERLGQSQFTGGHVGYERLFQSFRVDTKPLPPAIAARLDSDGDEIQRLLAEGGQVFYPEPRPQLNWGESNALWGQEEVLTGNEKQRLLIGVVGLAQQEALLTHPTLSVPYLDFSPAPPAYTDQGQPALMPEREAWQTNAASAGGRYGPSDVWPSDAQADAVCDAWLAARAAIRAAIASNTAANVAARDTATQQYLLQAKALVAALGMPVDADGVPAPPAALPSAPPWTAAADAFPKPWQVLAARWLAHAAMVRTGDANPAPTAQDRSIADRACESALAWGMRYDHADPYDWGAPRVIQAISISDFPLLQFDTFAPARTVSDGAGDMDASWPVISPRPYGAVNFGPTKGLYPGGAVDRAANYQATASSWGDPSRFTLTDAFAACERCRQIVFWAVDWQAYEDFESAPCAPLDAKWCMFDSRGVEVSAQDHFGLPERNYVWRRPVAAMTPGTAYPKGYFGDNEPDNGDYPRLMLGIDGADRNGNGVYDRGPLPRTARLRAITVARFNVYNPRLLMSGRL